MVVPVSVHAATEERATIQQRLHRIPTFSPEAIRLKERSGYLRRWIAEKCRAAAAQTDWQLLYRCRAVLTELGVHPELVQDINDHLPSDYKP